MTEIKIEELTKREKALLKIIEGVVDGFLKVYPKDFAKTVKAIDEALAEVGLKRTEDR